MRWHWMLLTKEVIEPIMVEDMTKEIMATHEL